MSCNLPIASGNILNNNYIYVGNQTLSGNFRVDIKDQNGNIIQSFFTNGTYTVEVLTTIMDTITANTGTITPPII
jgi:molybdopterin-biosynthesis enzyme MoeA-like protein